MLHFAAAAAAAAAMVVGIAAADVATLAEFEYESAA